MKKTPSLILYIVGVLLLITAVKLPFLYSSSTTTLAVILAIVGGIVFAVAWIGALIRTAQLGRWGWFVLLLLFSIVSLLIYILWGPTPDKLADLAAENQ
jgi:membrane protease YdiL (CAAX protease family)